MAVPPRWEELRRIDRSDTFDLARALRTVAKWQRPPWENYAKLKQILPR